MAEVARILQEADQLDPEATEQLLPLVYEELRRIASARMANQPPGQTLQATALVHEAYLRLIAGGERTWNDRKHFFAAAVEAMRHILVDRARRKAAVRHGGQLARQSFDEITIAGEATDDGIIRVNEALEALAVHNPEAAELVKLRFFGGFTLAQTGELLGVSERTAKRIWSYGRAWLFREIQRGD